MYANNGGINGRTTIQKLTYFTQLQVPFSEKIPFRPHYYGPYSAELDHLLYQLVGLRFLNSEAVSTSRNRIMYSYSLTKDGRSIVQELLQKKKADKLLSVVSTCRSVTNLNPDALSYAAKAHYILSQKKRSYSTSEVKTEGKKFGWRLNDTEVKQGVRVLLDLGLATKRKRAK